MCSFGPEVSCLIPIPSHLMNQSSKGRLFQSQVSSPGHNFQLLFLLFIPPCLSAGIKGRKGRSKKTIKWKGGREERERERDHSGTRGLTSFTNWSRGHCQLPPLPCVSWCFAVSASWSVFCPFFQESKDPSVLRLGAHLPQKCLSAQHQVSTSWTSGLTIDLSAEQIRT